MSDLDLNQEQLQALDAIIEWYINSTSQEFRLGGYAGTGKTTLLAEIRKELFLKKATKVAFVCYTGKASTVLSSKLSLANCFCESDFCGTIHSLIYRPVIDEKTDEIIEWELKGRDEVKYDLIAIDEGSMVGDEIYNDLKTYGIKMLIFGDHFQLPPVQGKLNLMENLDFALTKIHRQCEGNPIIKLSMMLRNFEEIPFGDYGCGVQKINKIRQKHITTKFIEDTRDFNDTFILCGINSTRCEINKKIRQRLGFDGLPVIGDRVICLKNNWNAHPTPVANGELGTIDSAFIDEENKTIIASIRMDGKPTPFEGILDLDTFSNPKPDLQKRYGFGYNYDTDDYFSQPVDFFDFGYALTVHKSQGSQAKRVLLLEEPCRYWQGETWFRWLYTGVTRSEEELLIAR